MLDYVIKGTAFYLVFESFTGGSLREKMETTTFCEKEALEIANQIADATF